MGRASPTAMTGLGSETDLVPPLEWVRSAPILLKKSASELI